VSLSTVYALKSNKGSINLSCLAALLIHILEFSYSHEIDSNEIVALFFAQTSSLKRNELSAKIQKIVRVETI
jgi:hypothetical protein